MVLYTVGVLHFLYDGFIWKLRKPAVAAGFAIRPAPRDRPVSCARRPG